MFSNFLVMCMIVPVKVKTNSFHNIFHNPLQETHKKYTLTKIKYLLIFILGSTFDDLGHIIFPEQILGSNDHRGFLFVRPTFQCLSKLTVPNTPYLVAILIHKWEVPWAKVFPIRLMLRLGAECRCKFNYNFILYILLVFMYSTFILNYISLDYPCSLVSIRHRKPVYFEIGQTIMSVLAVSHALCCRVSDNQIYFSKCVYQRKKLVR